jgi:hypothetical protein
VAHPPELRAQLSLACARLGKDASEARALLDAGELGLALEVLVDQYDALGLPLPPALARYGLFVQLRSEVEELQDALEGKDDHRFDAGLSSLAAALEEALAGAPDGLEAARSILDALFAPGRLLELLSGEERALAARIHALTRSLSSAAG